MFQKLLTISAAFAAFFALNAQATSLPARPTAPEHPGSASYEFSLETTNLRNGGRTIKLFLPKEAMNAGTPVPVIAFGHGQAMGAEYYNMTFEHLARKGIAVVFPEYSNGFFDQDWRRMANDFQSQVAKALETYSNLDPSKIVYSGHSKGAYVASIAAGIPASGVRAASVMLFNAAGFDRTAISQIDSSLPVTVIWSEADTIVGEDISRNIFNTAPAAKKQFILVKSYNSTSPALAADHFFIANKKGFFGGRNGISPFHFYGAWKWLIGAAKDLENRSPVTDPYAYGSETAKTGLADFSHELERSW